MMWCVWILLGFALCVDTFTVRDIQERLSHGRQLKIYLPKSVDKLEFTPASEPGKTFEYWTTRSMSRHLHKGYVSGTGSDRRWYLDKVTFDDEGTYTQKDYWNKEISTLKVAVTTRHDYIKRVAGQSLYISLEGIQLDHATLSFSGESANVTLVRDGSPVSRDLLDYYDRVKTHSTKIEITNVNTSDVGYYTLKDHRDRVVSVNRMELTDHLDSTDGNPLMALLLLLGIPAGICCCCRKKIFKRKPAAATTTTTFQAQGSPQNVPLPPAYGTPTGGVSVGPGGPVYYHNTGPAQDPNNAYPSVGPTVHPPPNPGMAGPQWNGPPPAMNPVYPTQDPMYPPAQPPQWNGPPPAQPPQWNGPPPAQPPQWNGPPPGPGAPMGYAPVMYSSPPPMAGDPAKASPTDPLLAHPPPVQNVPVSSLQPPVPPPTAPVTDSTGNAYQFQIEKGNSSSNFL